jgi:hypothetical protein
MKIRSMINANIKEIPHRKIHRVNPKRKLSTYKCKANELEVEQPRHYSRSYNADWPSWRASVSDFQQAHCVSLNLLCQCHGYSIPSVSPHFRLRVFLEGNSYQINV